jgi:hypothetical protein
MSVFKTNGGPWVPAPNAVRSGQIVDISRFFGGHDVWKENKPQQILPALRSSRSEVIDNIRTILVVSSFFQDK